MKSKKSLIEAALGFHADRLLDITTVQPDEIFLAGWWKNRQTNRDTFYPVKIKCTAEHGYDRGWVEILGRKVSYEPGYTYCGNVTIIPQVQGIEHRNYWVGKPNAHDANWQFGNRRDEDITTSLWRLTPEQWRLFRETMLIHIQAIRDTYINQENAVMDIMKQCPY